MATTAGRTGYPKITNDDEMDGPAQIDAIGAHFDTVTGESVATASGLPSSGNWVGRISHVQSDDTLRLCMATPNTWTIVGGKLPYYFGKRDTAALDATGSSQAWLTATVLANGFSMSDGVISVQIAGIYAVTLVTKWQAGGAGQRNTGVQSTATILGATEVDRVPSTIAGDGSVLTTFINASAGDTITPFVSQNSGSALTLSGNVAVTFITAP